MKSIYSTLLLLVITFLGCTSSMPDTFTSGDLVITKAKAIWANDSIAINEPNPPTPEERIALESATRPLLSRKVTPRYPSEAITAKLDGFVYVRVFVDSSGHPRKAVILKSQHDIFDQPVLHAIMFCQFEPAIVKRKPRSTWVAIEVIFHLDDNKPIAEYVEKERYP